MMFRVTTSAIGATGTPAVFDAVAAFCELPGPSGAEAAVAAFLRERWSPRVGEVREDAVGNLLFRVGGTGPRLLLHAHMDEIGWVVRHVTEDGFLLLDSAQGRRREGPERRYMVGQPAQVLGRDGVVARGVIAAASGHVLTRKQTESERLDWDDFFVDLGLGSREEVLALGIHVGAPVVWDVATRRVGRNLVGKAMDDRALLAVMDLLLDDLGEATLAWELWYGATIQEENGLHGASAVALRAEVERAIALDVGLVGDTPSVAHSEYETRLGAGPIVTHKDSGIVYDRRLTFELADAAEGAGVPFQHGVFAGYRSDGLPLMDHGVPTALLALPTRYTHTAFETVAESDVHDTVRLLKAFVT
jgi:putative aminopeptidase FrvX